MSKYKDSAEFVHRLTTMKLDCGRTLRELTYYQDIALWWFARFDFIDFLLMMSEDGADYSSKRLKFHARFAKLSLPGA